MSKGAQRAEAQPRDGTTGNGHQDLSVLLGPETQSDAIEYAEPVEKRRGPSRGVAILLGLLAVAWTAATIWSIARGSPALTLPNLLEWLAFISPPLILLGIAWLIFGHTSRRETERFTQAVAAMRSESTALESVLAIVSTRLEENHSKLRGEATKLMSLGDEASDRLGRVAYYLAKESASLDKKSEKLEAAAEAARVDIGVLLQDLPKAEEQARAVADAMKDAGLTAHGHAGALEGQLSALVARSREADDVAGGAAQRLAAHLARVESTTAAATARLDQAAASMTSVIDGTMARAAEAIDATRASLDAQSAALFAAIEQNRAALQNAGDDSARNLRTRLDAVGEKIETLAAHLAAQDAASHALIGSLHSELAQLDESFVELGRTGSSNTERLEQSIGAVRASLGGLSEELAGGHDRAGNLIGRTQEMAQALGSVAAQLNGDVPAALARVEEQATKTHDLVSGIAPSVAAMEASSTNAAARLAEAEASIREQQELLGQSGSALADRLMQQLGEVETRMTLLRENGGTSSSELGEAIAAIRGSVSELTDALEANRERTEGISMRAREVGDALAAMTGELDQRLPAALADVEQQASRAQEAVGQMVPALATIESSSTAAGERLAEAEASIVRQQELLENSGTALSTYLLQRLSEVEVRMAALRETGGSSAVELGDAFAGLRGSVAELTGAIDGNRERTEDLAGRARDVSEALATITTELDERLPAALARTEEHSARTREIAGAIAPEVEAVQGAAENAAAKLAEAETSLARQREALDQLLATLDAGLARAEDQLRALGNATQEADGAASRLVAETGPELIDGLLRVREAAQQAAERARETIATVIPQSAAALAAAGREALTSAISGPVEDQINELGQVAERAAETARKASERLTRQMVLIGETTAAVERRIDETRLEQEERDAENFSRRVALLMESLNSTAIDITKILSNEVTDTAWAAYLKGDRGVFTRRAVRLIDNSEARAILQHYESEPEFREQVNRYVHDFEAMLRRVLADRDSSGLGVTILSSDMGKLYVALAQAIERLR